MKTLFFIFGFFILSTFLSATIINIPADQTTIQEGINAAVDGDTVLVQPGTYIENINYNGKDIVVGSLFLTTQDTSYISQTIIDGDSSGSVVIFENGEDSTAVLCGFTVTNGQGFVYPNYSGGGITCKNSSNPTLENVTITENFASLWGGGICCGSSSPSLENVTITGNSAYKNGGGIYCWDYSNPVLSNVTISENTSVERGGGIFCEDYSSPSLGNVIITGNSADVGGGIYCYLSSPSLTNVTITGNSANWGGGIYCRWHSSPNFDTVNRCNIFLNFAGIGSDLYASLIIDVIVDTFTVLQPDDYFAYPINYFTFDILNNKVEQENQELYVSPTGSNDNSGLSPDEPLLTISYALTKIIADSTNPKVIHLASGTYSPSQTGEIFPLNCRSYVSLIGENEALTILEGEGLSSILYCYHDIYFSIENIMIKNGSASGSGGGIYCPYSNLSLINVTIIGNSASYRGGGIYCYTSSPSLENVTITDNSADYGGGIYCDDNSSPFLENIIITNNSSSDGGGIYCYYNSSPSIVNSIVSDNTGNYGIYVYYSGSPTITYSDFYNNEGGNFYGVNDSIGVNVTTNANGDSCDVFYNIQLDPLFVDPLNGDYHLSWANFPTPDSTMSPCIDAGDPNSPLDPDSTIADMGAYYYDQSVGVDDENHPLIETELFKNYPNPFNKITAIRYFLPKYSEVKIQIYNLKGQLVETVVDSNKPTGYYTIEWNAKDMSSGIYFFKLSTKDNTFINKMILMR